MLANLFRPLPPGIRVVAESLDAGLQSGYSIVFGVCWLPQGVLSLHISSA